MPGEGAQDAAREAFAERVGPLLDPLRRFLLRRTDPDTAEDVLAETLLVCWRRRADLPEAADQTLPWAYGTARRCLANAERSARRRRRLAARVAVVDPPPVAAAADDAAQDPRVAAVPAALARLPETDAEVLRLWAWEELAPREIARVLETTPNAVSSRLVRARRRLAAELGAPDPPAGRS